MNHTRPKLEGFTGIIDAILEADKDPAVPRKQRHTAHRIFERLRDEHGFTGGYTIVKDYVRSQRQSVREAFVPLHHPPGHTQVDFGEAVVEIDVDIARSLRIPRQEQPRACREYRRASNLSPLSPSKPRRWGCSDFP